MDSNIDHENDLFSSAEKVIPKVAKERFSKLLTPEDYVSTLESFGKPKPITFRANTLRTTEELVLNEVKKNNLKSTKVHWCPQCNQLVVGTIRELQQLPSFLANGIYIQSASSMLSVHALQVESDMRVLDLCAAPGSKTSQIAAIMNNQGMLVANDRSRKRLYRLREILQRQGAANVEVLCGPGERLGQTHADCFDRVLVDVPCSGEGRFRIERPIRLSKWSLQEIKTLSKKFRQIT